MRATGYQVIEGVCGSCAHWVQSPGNPAVGACWEKSEEALLVRASEAVCDRDLYQKGATLQQSLLGYSAYSA